MTTVPCGVVRPPERAASYKHYAECRHPDCLERLDCAIDMARRLAAHQNEHPCTNPAITYAKYPTGITAETPCLVLLKTSVREKRAYYVDGMAKLYWFDPWKAITPYIQCTVITFGEATKLALWLGAKRAF